MWVPTPEEIAYYKKLAQSDADDEYFAIMLPLLLQYVNDECCTNFQPPNIPAAVVMFLAGAIGFMGSAQPGLKSEKMGTVSFTYDFSSLPKFLTDGLSMYGFGYKRNRARYTPF